MAIFKTKLNKLLNLKLKLFVNKKIIINKRKKSNCYYAVYMENTTTITNASI